MPCCLFKGIGKEFVDSQIGGHSKSVFRVQVDAMSMWALLTRRVDAGAKVFDHISRRSQAPI
jgi:hypothetical protein